MNDLVSRTKQFSLRIIRLVQSLPRSSVSSVIGKQLLRSGTSVGANYRAACRAKSRADFIAKMNIVIEEADESLYWMELLCEAKIIPQDRLSDLMNETDQLISIFTASVLTAREKMVKEPDQGTYETQSLDMQPTSVDTSEFLPD
ncbi:four helix bundle protein [Longilinea arvoryzae]|uniref:Four helix bundle protein n=1 Tax=Longilinea arvoryzae TaxID=360412 RepID=A0A0S7BDW0_9CHLR|nr:four helix bundle protein [Longilinea arvoryzae]GAP12980.1 four helix bundle protein [Longilinea arvoryzae]